MPSPRRPDRQLDPRYGRDPADHEKAWRCAWPEPGKPHPRGAAQELRKTFKPIEGFVGNGVDRPRASLMVPWPTTSHGFSFTACEIDDPCGYSLRNIPVVSDRQDGEPRLGGDLLQERDDLFLADRAPPQEAPCRAKAKWCPYNRRASSLARAAGSDRLHWPAGLQGPRNPLDVGRIVALQLELINKMPQAARLGG